MMQRHHSLKRLPIVASLFLGKYFCTRRKDWQKMYTTDDTSLCFSSD